MTEPYARSLEELEAGVRVPRDEQVESEPVSGPGEYVAPEDLDRLQLLNNPAGAGRLKPRG